MEESILLTIKKMLGLDSEYTPFDMDVMVFINSALMDLHQLNVGPKEGFSISGPDETWGDFLTNPIMVEGAKTYVYLKVKMVFDPPGNSFVMEAYKSQAEEIGWRLVAQTESVEKFDFVEEQKKLVREMEGELQQDELLDGENTENSDCSFSDACDIETAGGDD